MKHVFPQQRPEMPDDLPENQPDVFPQENPDLIPSATPIMGQPESAQELINKYGTYNIQPTSDTENEFPAIAAGRPSAAALKKQAGKE